MFEKFLSVYLEKLDTMFNGERKLFDSIIKIKNLVIYFGEKKSQIY